MSLAAMSVEVQFDNNNEPSNNPASSLVVTDASPVQAAPITKDPGQKRVVYQSMEEATMNEEAKQPQKKPTNSRSRRKLNNLEADLTELLNGL